jgi:hypothetical protein
MTIYTARNRYLSQVSSPHWELVSLQAEVWRKACSDPEAARNPILGELVTMIPQATIQQSIEALERRGLRR